MKSKWLRMVVLVIFLLAVTRTPGTYTAKAAPPAPGLFSTEDVVRTNVSWADEFIIVRTRFVRVSFDLLEAYEGTAGNQSEARLQLNLFDDVSLTAVFDRLDMGYQGSRVWVGHVEGAEYGQVTLVFRDGVLVGEVRASGKLYQVQYVGDGIHAIHEIDQSALPPDADPMLGSLSEAVPLETPKATVTDDGSIIDVLVVYTGAARAGAGGTTAMQNLISGAESQTNTGYARSGVIQRIHVVHTAEIGYSEDGFNWQTTLYRLTGTTDGYMDNVHTLRDAYLADLVVLIVNSCYGGTCGIAWVNSTAPYGFSLVSRTTATNSYDFAHELGHNMGCAHNRENVGALGMYPYSFGYRVSGVFATIMAFGPPRINNWSNPEVTYAGYPTGVHYQAPNSADNRRTLNNTRFAVANFRAPDSTPPTKASNVRPSGWTGPYTSDATSSFQWNPASDSGSGIAGYYVAVDDWTPEGGSGNDWWAGNVTAFTVPDAQPDGEHIFAVTSKDNAGNVNPPNTNQQGDAPYYTFFIDTTAPTNPTVIDSGCAAQDGIWQRDCTDPAFTWYGASDHGGAGVNGYRVYWGPDPSGVPTVWCSAAGYDPGMIDTSSEVVTYYLRISTRDNLGHESTPETVFTLRYDASAPTTNPLVAGGAETVHLLNIRIEPRAHDTGSGLGTTYLSDDSLTWHSEPYAADTTWVLEPLNRRLQTVYLMVEDKAGNRSSQHACWVCLDLYPAHPSSVGYRLWSAGPIVSGNHSTSPGYRLHSTAGQSSMGGNLSSINYRLHSGFQALWPAYPGLDMFTPFSCWHRIYLPVTLRGQ
jgi:hypothetical protein